jgi:phosphohistidine phosphatase
MLGGREENACRSYFAWIATKKDKYRGEGGEDRAQCRREVIVMRVYLMQHGQAVSEEQDPQRPLSDTGRAQVETSATAIVRLGLKFDAMVVSSKVRSRQTAEIVAKVTGYTGGLTEIDAFKPSADPEDGIAALARLSGRESVFIAGHMPSLVRIVSLLLTESGKVSVVFSNGGLCAIEAAELPTHKGTLLFSLTPDQLRLIAS